jgi:catechol 2,3-dioxygenase-like lactoylglutathione lyase family enzyme
MTEESVLSGVTMASTIIRVRDVAASVEWFRDKLGLEPLHVGADGEHKIAAYVLGGMVVSLWQLPHDERRRREDADRNSYVVLVVDDDPAQLHAELQQRGVEVGEYRESENNSFFWFYDRDDNRFEVARPRTAAGRAAREDAEKAISV